MFTLNLTKTICDLRTILSPPDPKNPEKGIVFQLRLNLSGRKGDQLNFVERNAWVAICGNSKVFVSIEPPNEQWYFWPNVKNWENTSNHDICWRLDGLNILNKIYDELTLGFSRVNDHSEITEISLVNIETKLIDHYRREIVKISTR